MTRITICCAEDSVFGGDTQGYDVEQSLRHYAELAAAVVQERFPDAAIDTTFEPQMWAARAATPSGDDDEADQIEYVVADLCARIHENGDWTVRATSLASA